MTGAPGMAQRWHGVYHAGHSWSSGRQHRLLAGLARRKGTGSDSVAPEIHHKVLSIWTCLMLASVYGSPQTEKPNRS